jgi:hypothetical protein
MMEAASFSRDEVRLSGVRTTTARWIVRLPPRTKKHWGAFERTQSEYRACASRVVEEDKTWWLKSIARLGRPHQWAG